VREAGDGIACMRELFEARPALVILDVAMPRLDGWQTLERIREVSDVPVLMLTARDHEVERVRGLRAGADDYIVKPFGNMELQARVDALLRRARPAESRPTRYADGFLSIDHARREVSVGGQPIALTPTELRLLVALVERSDRVVSRDELAELLWRPAPGSPPMEVKQYLSTLRRKLERAAGRPAPIETRRGFGYRYVASGGRAETA